MRLNLDDAWFGEIHELAELEAKKWGPHLRFSAPLTVVEEFFSAHDAGLPSFLVYGSGDFHHLTALWIRRTTAPIVVVSFDNHPDWDIRPPKWCCGSWVNRALELPHVQKVSVWGCGNFECWWPGQVFGNRRAERAGRLEVRVWADDRPVKDQQRRGALFRETWRAEFERFVDGLAGGDVYVTIDLDCLRAGEAVTNWENGKFRLDDVVWALGCLQRRARIVAGDICGAFSEQKYARAKQRFVARLDHPKLPRPDKREAIGINTATVEKLWTALTDGNQHHAGGDQQ